MHVFNTDLPDVGSYITCPVTDLPVNTVISCLLFPLSSLGQHVPVPQYSFSLSLLDAQHNNISQLLPPLFGSFFTFQFSAGAVSERESIYNGISPNPFELIITGVSITLGLHWFLHNIRKCIKRHNISFLCRFAR